MIYKSTKFKILLALILLFVGTVWSQEETVPIVEGDEPPQEFNACNARQAAIDAARPKLARPKEGYQFYENQIQIYEPRAGNTEFDQEKYDALKKAEEKRVSNVLPIRNALNEKINQLEADLFNAQNQFTDKSRIAELKARLDATRQELEATYDESTREPYFRMEAAHNVLEAKRSMGALVLWQEFDNINNYAILAEQQKDKELESVKAQFQKVQSVFDQQALALKQQPDRSEATLQKARELKEQTTAVLGDLKTRLLNYECFPDVGNYIMNPIESTIFKLNRWKVSAEDDPVIEEIPEDTLDLPTTIKKGSEFTFTGKWDSSFGILTLTQSGNAVSGSSDYYSTQVNGTIKEDGKLHFHWSDSNNKKGVGVFELNSDGASFSGSWNYLLSDGKTLGLGGTWGGRRIN